MKACAHILIVDDEINIRGALVTMLEKKGYQVRGVATAEEGWSNWKQLPPIWSSPIFGCRGSAVWSFCGA